MDGKRDILISKALSYLLRHGAIKENLSIDNNGFISIEALLNHNRLKTHKCTREDIERIVENNDKKRFVIDYEKNTIAATQGHSMKIKPDDSVLVPITQVSDLPEKLIHGTNLKHCLLILESGKLLRMGRNHIHLSPGIVGKDSQVISGMRKNSNIFIYIKKDQDTLSHLQLFKSLNNVYLCGTDLSITDFEKVEIRTHDKSDLVPEIIELLKQSSIPYEII